MSTEKLRKNICYQNGTTNCFNCAHADKNSWKDEQGYGVCNLISGRVFIILKQAICKFHSAFNHGHGNIKYS